MSNPNQENFEMTTNQTALNPHQANALARLSAKLAVGNDLKFHVTQQDEVGSAVMVQGFVGSDPTRQRWFEDSFGALLGARGAVRICSAPDWFRADWDGKRWCGFEVRCF